MGKVKPLVVKVAFPDYSFESVYTNEKLLRLFNGASDNSNTENVDSLGGYYKTSSYGQLDICCEEIYEYTALHERDFYDRYGQYDGQYSMIYNECDDGQEVIVQGNPYMNSIEESYDFEIPEYQLVDEMLAALDDEIDYRDYDSDGDGYIDAIYINFAGPSGEWGGTWWPHVDVRRNSGKFDGVQYKAYSMIHNYGDGEYNEDQDLLVLIHETGHLLGLPDYYSYSGENSNMLGTFDIMTSVEEGDHNGFSKWTYGWLGDDDIEYIDRERGETTVHLTNMDADRKDGKMVAVIAPDNAKENGIYSKYFLVEYDAGTNLNNGVFEKYSLTPGFRIFAVNAILDEETGTNYQKNDNYEVRDRLIYDVKQTRFYGVDDTLYREGDRFAPDTKPASRFYFDNSKVGKSTGIVISDFVTGDNPSFKVSFTEADEEEYDVNFTGNTQGVGNMLNIKLYSSVPLDIMDYGMLGKAYLQDEDGRKYSVEIIEDTNEEDAYIVFYSDSEHKLKPNTSYTLVIPQDTFKVTESQILDEVRIAVTTGDFEKLDYFHKIPVNEMYEFKSNYVRVEDNTIVGLMGKVSSEDGAFDIKLQRADIEGNEEKISGIRLPIVADNDEYSGGYLYTEANIFGFEDGTIAVGLYYLNRLTYYHLDKNGKLIGEPQVAPVSHYDKAFSTGHYIKGLVYDRSKDISVIFSIDFENPPVKIESDSYVHGICDMENGEYAITCWKDEHYALYIYNGDDELTGEIPIEFPFYALTYTDNTFYYLDNNLCLGKMDREGNIMEETNIQQIAEPLLSVWDSNLFDIEVNAGRIMVSGIIESGYKSFKYVCFFDKELNHIGYREFYNEESDVILLKNGIMYLRDTFDINESKGYTCLYRMFYKDNSSEETTDPEEEQTEEDQTEEEQTEEELTDEDKTEDGTREDAQESGKTSGETVSVIANMSSPDTGDELPLEIFMLAGSAAVVLITGRKKG